MRVSTNIKSMVAQRYVQQHTEAAAHKDSELSSGSRIVRAADDPAGLAISDRMRAFLKSNSQAERNTNDSISLLQVAEGSLATMTDMTSRLRELAMQSSTDTVSDMDRVVIDKEFQQLKREVERLTVSTSFNGNQIIKGSESVYDLQIGINGSEKDRIRYDMSKIMDSTNNFGINSINLRSKESSQQSLSALDKMLTQISSSRAILGGVSNRMNNIMSNLQISSESLSASHSKIKDADVAAEAANQAKIKIAQSASLSMLKLSNDSPGMILKLVGG